MPKFHSTVSRRDFMKGIGLASAGLGAAAAAAPVFHDLDEVTSAPDFSPKMPWWVKTTDTPTVEIDWTLMQRFDQQECCFVDGYVKFFDEATRAAHSAESGRQSAEFLQAATPGAALRDRAIASSVGAMRGSHSGNDDAFIGPRRAATPEQRGVSKWSGSPEENARMVRNVAKLFGASTVGFVQLESATTEKFIWSIDKDRKKINFENVDVPYETETTRVIPNKARTVVIFTTQVSEHMQQIREPLGDVTRSQSYARGFNIEVQLAEFCRGLGYQGMSQTGNNGLFTKNALAVMAGLGEMGRFSYILFPNLGPTPRTWAMITDLPLAPTTPIDAGMTRFCHTCKKCAEHCPKSALSLETDPTYETLGPWNMLGAKRWQYHAPDCYSQVRGNQVNWNICQAVCTFTKLDDSSIHEVIQATVANTGLFNGFFRTMDDVFGYGEPRDATDWWETDIIAFGYNNTRAGGVA
jgi:reductive dehalogenase